MGIYEKRPDRLVLPRWRDFKETSKTNELSKEKNTNSPILPNVTIEKQLKNWQKEKSVVTAIELINAAFVINNKPAAADAARFFIQHCNDEKHPLLIISNEIINKPKEKKEGVTELTPVQSFENLQVKIQSKIHALRIRLKLFPQNSMLWIDLARWYTVVGKIYGAERCMKIALQLSSQNVFVIRSAVRFYIHKSQFDKNGEDSLSFALQLIRKNPATKVDPWLMATEISLCSYLEKTSSLMKAGFSLIGSKNFSPFALSELSAALATEELKNSSAKSKKLFTNSLINPNENTVAQAQWASDIVGDLPLNLQQHNSFEAASYLNLHNENWNGSLDEALGWIADQPFSREPANHASYLASAIIDDNDLTMKVCDFGLRANPRAFPLLNNKSYSLVIAKNTAEAEKIFNQIDFSALNENEKIAYTATKGLIVYSKGDKTLGDFLYNEAEAIAKRKKDERSAFRVRIYKTRAEFLFDNSEVDAKTAIGKLTHELANFEKYPDLKKTVDNLRQRLKSKEAV